MRYQYGKKLLMIYRESYTAAFANKKIYVCQLCLHKQNCYSPPILHINALLYPRPLQDGHRHGHPKTTLAIPVYQLPPLSIGGDSNHQHNAPPLVLKCDGLLLKFQKDAVVQQTCSRQPLVGRSSAIYERRNMETKLGHMQDLLMGNLLKCACRIC